MLADPEHGRVGQRLAPPLQVVNQAVRGLIAVVRLLLQ
jgi:hypothetical protein